MERAELRALLLLTCRSCTEITLFISVDCLQLSLFQEYLLRWEMRIFKLCLYFYRPQRSFTGICDSVHGGECSLSDTSPGQTPPGQTLLPLGRHPLGRHPSKQTPPPSGGHHHSPQTDTPPPCRRLLQWKVRILLECILVLK